MGEMLTLTAEDGFRLSAYKAMPAGKPRGAVVVVQEIFGVNHHIKAVTDGFAADGYVSLAPAIFDRVEPGFETGYAPADIERGRATRMKLSLDQMVMDVKAAVQELSKTGLKVGVVGYCLGGTMAWLAATRIPRRRRRRGLLRRGHRGHRLRAAEVPGAAPLRRDRRLDPARALGQGPRGAPEAARPHLRRRRPRLQL